MATHVFIHLHPAELETSPAYETRPEAGIPIGLRRSSGFVRAGDTVYVRTSAGLSTARGVLVAIGLQWLLAAGALLLWQLVH